MMLHSKIKIVFLSLGMMTLAACSQEESTKNIATGDSRKMLLTSTIGATTRSTNQNLQASQLVNGNTIGVYVTDEANEVLCDNIKAIADGDGGFTYTRDLFWPLEGKANVYAYGPYQESFTKKLGESATFTVAEDQTTDDGYLASDLIFGLPVSDNPLEQTTNAVPIAFNHMLVKVNIYVTNKTQTSLEGATVFLKDIANTVTVNTKTGYLGASSGMGTIKAATFSANANSYKCSAIIAPQMMTYGSKVAYVILKDGSILEATLHTDMELKSGNTYNFSINVIVGGMDITITASSLSDWDSNTDGLTADTDLDDAQTEDNGTSATEKLYATFKKPASNASYSEPTYSWTGSTNNLMTCFEFNGGELANYDKLTFTLSNISSGGKVRIGYYVGRTWTELANYDSNGQKTIDLTNISNRSEVTKISFGGSNNSGSVDVKASDMYLSGKSSSGGSSDTPTAVFGKPGGNASYEAPTYSWTATTNNLMEVYKFENGELKDYKTLTFKIANLTGGMVRIGYYVGTTFTEFKNADGNSGFGSNGTKTIDLTAQGIDLSTVEKISFGGKSGAGSVDIVADDFSLSK